MKQAVYFIVPNFPFLILAFLFLRYKIQGFASLLCHWGFAYCGPRYGLRLFEFGSTCAQLVCLTGPHTVLHHSVQFGKLWGVTVDHYPLTSYQSPRKVATMHFKTHCLRYPKGSKFMGPRLVDFVRTSDLGIRKILTIRLLSWA